MISDALTPELGNIFPFEYAGGGYFRRRGAPTGQPAEILHGMQAIQFVYDAMTSTQQSNNAHTVEQTTAG